MRSVCPVRHCELLSPARAGIVISNSILDRGSQGEQAVTPASTLWVHALPCPTVSYTAGYLLLPGSGIFSKI